MSMKALDELRSKLCEELDEIARKPEMSAGDLETVHKLTDTIKNIDKIAYLEEEGYSQAGDWEMEGRGSYGRGNSYANHGQHYVRGHYSRDGGREGRGGGGMYSRASDGRDRMIEKMERLMDSADSETERDAIRRCISQLEKS